MQRQVLWVSPFQSALVMWFVGFMLSYPVIGVMWFFNQYATTPATMNWIILTIFPLIIGTCISILAGLGAFFYNLTAKLGLSVDVRVGPNQVASVDANCSLASGGTSSVELPELSKHVAPVRIEYENNFSDLIIFHAVHQFLSPVLQVLYVSFFVFIFWSESQEGDVTSAAITALFWYLGLWILQFIFNVIYLFSRKNVSVLTKHILEIQDDALFEETKYNKSLVYWHGIVKVVSRPGFVAIYITPHMAHIIPSRAFSSEEQRTKFLTMVKSKINFSVVAA